MSNNPLMCDIESGMCELPAGKGAESNTEKETGGSKLKVVYFTDPICSTCWGIEPQLRKLKLDYGDALDIEYRMGGLLPDWDYSGGGISQPSDVAHHWDEVSAHYDMPIDGDVWLEDPLHSSYPPSIAVKAAQLQDEEKSIAFLRRIREMVFLEKKNITKWEHLLSAASAVGLDVAQFEKDYNGKAFRNFQEDLELAHQYGVRGFPTLFFLDDEGQQHKVYGIKPYKVYESVVTTLLPKVKKASYPVEWSSMFERFPTMATREFAELTGQTREAGEALLEELAAGGRLKKLLTKNGVLWINPLHLQGQ